MSLASDLPDIIPLFAQPGAMLLPRSHLTLHIFEPHYLAMLEDTLKTRTRLIGVIQPAETPDGPLQAIGCAGRIMAFSEALDGRYMISLYGISRFRMMEEVKGFPPYRRGAVDWPEFDSDRGIAEVDHDLDRNKLIQNLSKYLAERDIPVDWDDIRKAAEEPLINTIAILCPFDAEDKQALLEAPNLTARRKILMKLFEFSLHRGNSGNTIQ